MPNRHIIKEAGSCLVKGSQLDPNNIDLIKKSGKCLMEVTVAYSASLVEYVQNQYTSKAPKMRGPEDFIGATASSMFIRFPNTPHLDASVHCFTKIRTRMGNNSVIPSSLLRG